MMPLLPAGARSQTRRRRTRSPTLSSSPLPLHRAASFQPAGVGAHECWETALADSGKEKTIRVAGGGARGISRCILAAVAG